MPIKHQRAAQNHTQDSQFISRGYCAASNGDSLRKLGDAQTLYGPDVGPITSDLLGFSSNPFWLNQACNAATHCWRVAKKLSQELQAWYTTEYRQHTVGNWHQGCGLVFLSERRTSCTNADPEGQNWSMRYTNWNVYSRRCRCTDTDRGWTSCEVRLDPVRAGISDAELFL